MPRPVQHSCPMCEGELRNPPLELGENVFYFTENPLGDTFGEVLAAFKHFHLNLMVTAIVERGSRWGGGNIPEPGFWVNCEERT